MSVTRPGWPSCWSMGCCGAASCPGGHPRAAGPDPLPQAADPGPHRRGPAGPKTLEDAGIKLDSVAADVLGVSGRAMLVALINGERDPQVLAELARGRLRAKLPRLRQALRGRFGDHHGLLVRLAPGAPGAPGGRHCHARHRGRPGAGPVRSGQGPAGHHHRGGEAGRGDDHRRDRRRHGGVPYSRAPGVVGGALPGQQPHRWHAPLGQAHQGQPLAG